jgi:multiple sugar transport system ATP-binding protein
MNNGLLQQVGPPQTLYDHPVNKFVAGFIGSPSMNFVPVQLEGGDGTARLKGPDMDIPMPERLKGAIGPKTGKQLTAGIRPEHFEIGAPEGSNEAPIRARTDVVEFLGNEELLHLRMGEHDIVAIVNAEHRVKPGDVLDMKVDLDKLHLFEDESGLALDAPRTAPPAEVPAREAQEEAAASA